MNPFDIAVYVLLAAALIVGYRAGVIRSAATILAYAMAVPLAITLTPRIAAMMTSTPASNAIYSSSIFIGLLLIGGILISLVLRLAIDEAIGPTPSVPDRIAGSVLGAVRIGLVAVTVVLVFDRLIPANREPAFLKGSQLRPWLSIAAKKGLKSLPPETASFIDRMKQSRGT
ncbi:MAG: hypothetical protein A4S14_03075 [Proteobacteria bacterium SG_bin9]|nr:MAG: hypothetical protein A4S14_03075 [Proteobacteria bacterium SG_bin9]